MSEQKKMTDPKQDLSFQLKLEQLNRNLDNATQSLKEFTKLAEGSKELKEWAENEITKYALSLKSSKLDQDELGNFFQYPYCIMPAKHEGEYYLAIPKFINAQFGWLEKVTPSYNIFLVNKYVDWLGELPQALKTELKFPDPLDVYFDGEYLVGSDIKKAKEKYSQFIRREEKDGRLLIDKSRHFELLANLVKDGILPFIPKQIDESDYVQRKCNFELRDYQNEAWKEFQKYSNIGAFFPPSTGKTFLGLWAMTHLKPPHLVVVPSRLLIEQWKERIELYTDLQPDEYDVMTYYGGIKSDKKYKLMIIDECLSSDSLIIKDDGGIQEIHNIKNNDNVLGGHVSNFFTKTSTTLKIITNFSDLVCTSSHPHFILRRIWNKHLNQNQFLESCEILVIPTNEINLETDYLLVPEKIPHTTKNELTQDQLRFVALIACDDHIEKNKNVIKVCISKKEEIEWVRNVFTKGVNSFSPDSKIHEFFNCRDDYTIWVSSRELKNILVNQFNIPDGNKSKIIDIPKSIFYSQEDSILAFIDGCFSSEGWYYKEKNGSNRIYFACTSKIFTTKIQLLLKKFGLHSYSTTNYRNKTKHNTLYQIYVGGKDFNCFQNLITFSKLSLNTINKNSDRFMNNVITYNNSRYRIAKIKSIKLENSSEKVFDFTCKQTNSFIANGFLTHNCHHLPANEFSKLATIQREYCIGLSATPQREDGREEYIFALTGKPIGLAWETFKKLGIIASPPLHVWIVKNEVERLKRVGELLQEEKKTIVFADSIEMGKTYSKRFGIPHIYGTTKQRLSKIQDNLVTVVSRVGDEGVSLPDIERVIEISFLFGSRRQELQRFTRLLHGKGTSGEGHIIMTIEEYQNHHKRLFGIMDKGFKIVLHREGIPEKEIRNIGISSTKSMPKERVQRITQTTKPSILKISLSEEQYPLLKYAGIRKIVESLNKAQQKVMLFLIDPQNQNQSFTVQQIALSLGYTNPLSLTTHPIIPPLVKKGYITKDADKYKQNFSSMV